ncbi:MAG: hypothetical protein H0T73_08445, partial [Ardenticatenales bacterium]|nr:hypothetical protein [Ardenticatenales bacterium]
GAVNRETVVLAAFGGLWGFLYGAIINLYFWPYTLGGTMNWTPGLSIAESVQRYALFYAVTSLWWDAIGAVSNVAMILLFGAAILKVLRRFQRRFYFAVGEKNDARHHRRSDRVHRHQLQEL